MIFSNLKPSSVIFFSIFSKSSLLSHSIHIRTGALSLFDFFIYSNLAISSFGQRHHKKSFNAHSLCGKLMIKYLFFPSNFILLSFTSGSLSKSKFPPLTIRTTFFPFIFSLRSFSISVERAQAGSTTIPSSLKYSNIVEQTLFSGLVKTSRLYLLHISKFLSPTLLTLAPSTKIFIFSRVVFSHFSSEFFIEFAQRGSTPIIFVFFLRASVTLIIPEISPPHHTGQII